MEHFPGWPQLTGQIVLAVFIIIQTLVQYRSSSLRRKADGEERAKTRKEEREDRAAIAAALLEAQMQTAEAQEQLLAARAESIQRHVLAVHAAVEENTKYNVEAIKVGNNFNEKLIVLEQAVGNKKEG